jgi:hypothetical protein
MDMHTSLFAWYYLRRGATRGQFDVFFKEVEHAYPEARMLLVDEPGLSLRNVGEIHEHTHVLEGQRDMMVYYSSDPTAFREEHHGRSHLDFDGHAEFAVSVWEPPGDLDVRAADRRRVVTVATFGGTWTAMEESRVLSMRMTELFLLLGSTLGARAGLFSTCASSGTSCPRARSAGPRCTSTRASSRRCGRAGRRTGPRSWCVTSTPRARS